MYVCMCLGNIRQSFEDQIRKVYPSSPGVATLMSIVAMQAPLCVCVCERERESMYLRKAYPSSAGVATLISVVAMQAPLCVCV
jgi:hypothetical protein